jgi:hypothetical protein
MEIAARRPNKGMNLTRVGAGSLRSRRGAASPKVAAQVMPSVRPTTGLRRQTDARPAG